jgi:ADP-ribose pyrophosphatase
MNEKMNWKILSSEYLTDKPYFTARKDKCETPSGKIISEYYVVELDLTMCALGITEDNQAVMVKQYRHPVNKTLLEIPGGFADENEAPEKAIAREMLEETGYEFDKFELVAEIMANPGVLTNHTNLYLATGGKKVSEQKLDANEEIKVELIPLDDLIEMVLQNKIEQALHVTCIFYSLIRLGKLKVNL